VQRPKAILHFSAVLALLLLFTGCGYRVHRQVSLPFTEIRIGRIVNQTLEPKLQDRLHKALTEEFVKQGIRVSSSAPLTLTGTVTRFDLSTLSEKGGVTLDYRLAVEAVFSLTNREGKIVETKKISGPFIVSFSASEDMGRLLATKDLAGENACRDIALRLVGALIYR